MHCSTVFAWFARVLFLARYASMLRCLLMLGYGLWPVGAMLELFMLACPRACLHGLEYNILFDLV